MSFSVIVCEDNQELARFYKKLLEQKDYSVITCSTSNEFEHLYAQKKPHVVIMDLRLAGSEKDGLQLMEHVINAQKKRSKVVVISGEASRSEVARAMQLGAYTFIEKSGTFNKTKFLADVKAAIQLKIHEDENIELRSTDRKLRHSLLNLNPFIGESKCIQQVKKLAATLAQADVDVMIAGETGTGKEIIANHIVYQSNRAGGPFIKVNAGGFPDTLVDSELFGHTKGAFTDAHTDKKGCFEKAHKGYLFLDEIANLNLQIQAKILRAIEYREINVIGGSIRKVDVRFIFASNKNLYEMADHGQFREDLYYRLGKHEIFLPPLRDRGTDILLLMDYFFKQGNKKHDCVLNYELHKLCDKLHSYPWPGNVRELGGFCENLLIRYNFVDNNVILEELEQKKMGVRRKCDESLLDIIRSNSLSTATDNFERKYLMYHLQQQNYQISKTAELIGVERTTLYKKMKRLGIISP